MGLQEDIKIDMFKLHLEWERQAELYAKWASLHVEAINKRDVLKVKCDIKHSALGTDIRDNYTRYGLDKKPTESSVEALINMNPDYQKLMFDLVEANKQVNMLQAGRTALEHKKRALEGLERLRLADYFGTTVASDAGKSAMATKTTSDLTAFPASERLRNAFAEG